MGGFLHQDHRSFYRQNLSAFLWLRFETKFEVIFCAMPRLCRRSVRKPLSFWTVQYPNEFWSWVEVLNLYILKTCQTAHRIRSDINKKRHKNNRPDAHFCIWYEKRPSYKRTGARGVIALSYPGATKFRFSKCFGLIYRRCFDIWWQSPEIYL